MNLSCLLSLLKELPAYRQLVARLSANKGKQTISVLDVAKPYFIAALYEGLNLPILVITAQPEDARRLYEQLQVWCSSSANLRRLPELDFPPPSSASTMLERLQILATLSLGKNGNNPPFYPENSTNFKETPPLIVSSALATMIKTSSQGDFASACYVLHQGMAANPTDLIHKWQGIGYEMENVAEVPGQMSKRGGIVDIFTPCNQLPTRIEFFGNQIESIRLFDPESQRSTMPISSITITPAKELSDTGTIFDYLSDNALIILDDFEEIEATVQKLYAQSQEQGELTACLAWEELEPKIRTRRRLVLKSSVGNDEQALPFTSSQNYGGRLEGFFKAAKQMVQQKRRVLIVSHQANRLAELLQEEGIYTNSTSQLEQIPLPGSIVILQGSLLQGWELPNILNLITDAELFGFVKQARPSRKTPVRRSVLFPQLMPGDYVVHVDHGIARFNGLTRMSTNGTEREYLVLEYSGSDRLYVPTEQIERISRYIGGSDQAPILSRLGTQEWQRTKERVKQSVADIAKELLGLYAAREITPGFAFSPDTLWQQELEASFPYMETPDQLEAIRAVKEDMERLKPMDRLICGDVGYGKTEVALRAAFKAVMDNKQVAILVPTTVLAQQHFATFGERLQAFPLKVEMMSRFCSPEKEKEILKGLASGTIDICVGTHRLLQKDIVFKNLGLVIVDEEQQFGVVQKEKLKQVRKEVDTIALSATPIPRTLHMSLAGVRDMSIIETPPEERLPIKTYVGAYDDILVMKAIFRELERNGQLFFVHNRVQSIVLAASKLQALVPEARIAIAHGQMPEEELEKVMADFIAGTYDILVTTTIVQLGLDIPNVNTLIVDQADKFGLAQLYQLRGRIGRGINQAYAYFLYDGGKQLSPQARKRLKTISEATELGAGFGIALKDLEIRGAGNLLGVKQSGHIAEVGFDLYCHMLAEAVEKLKAKQGDEIKKNIVASKAKQFPSISLPLTAYIPEEYVPNLNTRLSLYRRLAAIDHIEEVKDIAQELRDRFGTMPEPVENLIYIVRIKVLATKAEVNSISMQGSQIVIRYKKVPNLHLAKYYDGAVKIGTTQIKLDTSLLGPRRMKVLEEVLALF